MARIRTIKPDFFLDDELDELDERHQKLFIGLWCLSDREGKLFDHPKKIKAQVFPYRDYDVDEMLWALAEAGFIARYDTDSGPVIKVLKFEKHQRPHPKEPALGLPDPPPAPKSRGKKRPASHEVESNPVETPQEGKGMDPGSLDPGSLEKKPPPPTARAENLAAAVELDPLWKAIQAQRKSRGLPEEISRKTFDRWVLTIREERIPDLVLLGAYGLYLGDKHFADRGWPTNVFCRDGVWRDRAAQVAARAQDEPPTEVPCTPAGKAWFNALERMRLDGKTYALEWLRRCEPVEVVDGVLRMRCPDRYFVDWVRDHYGGEFIDDLTGCRVDFFSDEKAEAAP